MLKDSHFYIDLGTANTLIHSKYKSFTINEPTMIVSKKLNRNQSEYLAMGIAAKGMQGKTPLTSLVLKPLSEGVISDFNSASNLLRFFRKRIKEESTWLNPRILISLPCLVNHHEKNAVKEIARDIGARNVQLVDEPMLAALGSGINVLESKGHMVVDIGGGTSEAAIISLGGIVVANAIRIGGDSLDEAIISHLKNKYLFHVGEQTVEKIKINVACAAAGSFDFNKLIEIGGIDMTQGLPRKIKVSSEMIAPPVESFVKEIIKIIKKTFEDCPPELAGDIAENGIVLAGGGSLLQGLPERIIEETGVLAKRCCNPLLSVTHGGIKLLHHNTLLERLQTG
tara:strand:- start:573 stop:1592 length:1020 start_codon:yes stop_codon:yes gene_type:complete